MSQKVFSSSYISELCMELYLIVRAGIPFQEGIALLMEDETEKDAKAFLENLYLQMDAGVPLAEAFRQNKAFPHYAAEMIAIGQRTGHLEKVFYALANYYERVAQIKQSIYNIIWYPMILLTMMLFVVVVLLVKVMPIFADVFAQLGAELSPAAQMLLQLGQAIGSYGLYGFVILMVVMIVIVILYKKTSFSVFVQQRFAQITATWKVNKLLLSSRLAEALVLTLSSGITIDEALDWAGKLIQNQTVQEQIANCKKTMLLEGKSFADACMEHRLFSPTYCRMIAVGFRTGDIDAVMSEVARRVAGEADDALDALLNRIEPTLVIILSLMVGFILLSVMLPLMGLMTAIG